MKTDSTDLAIMRALREDGRRTFESIAEETKISTSAVKARFYKMKKSGLIIGTTVRFNIYALGGYITQLCVRTAESETETVESYIQNLKLDNRAIFCWKTIGHYNILAWAYLRDPIKLHLTKHMLQQHPGVIEVNASVLKTFKTFLQYSSVACKESKPQTLDNLDISLIEMLQEDARIPFSKLATNLKVGIETVLRRYNKLKENGVIENPTLVLDSRILGYEGLIDFLIKVNSSVNPEQVQNQLGLLEGVTYSALTLGDNDIYISVFFRDIAHVINIVKQMKSMKEITSLEPLIYLSQNWTIPISAKTNSRVSQITQTSIVRSLFSNKE